MLDLNQSADVLSFNHRRLETKYLERHVTGDLGSRLDPNSNNYRNFMVTVSKTIEPY